MQIKERLTYVNNKRLGFDSRGEGPQESCDLAFFLFYLKKHLKHNKDKVEKLE